ncbi:HAD family phosphatase [Propioniciclava sinopodophylli]|uniref:HAD family phosphatase n=1 Tax=Propioniciclava sinopodophylli TaxID=1837344 RepID=A0A4Q9KD13_9ACTN|nr:HAD family phosphatase [Propioniciclava sinopodophylli]
MQAVVFDMDGTLTDSEQEWDVVRRGLAEADRLAWPEEATKAMMGMSTPEWSAYLVETVGLFGSAEEVARRTIDAMADAYREGRIPVLHGAVDAVNRMAEIAPLAVASSSPRVLIEAGLGLLGVRDKVAVVVSTEEVARGKPHPDGFLAACDALRVDPAATLAIEDSTNGLKSALAAGMRVVAVPPRFHPPAPDVLARAHAVIDDLDALTVDLVQSLFT